MLPRTFLQEAWRAGIVLEMWTELDIHGGRVTQEYKRWGWSGAPPPRTKEFEGQKNWQKNEYFKYKKNVFCAQKILYH
jgi:hypothetical protein